MGSEIDKKSALEWRARSDERPHVGRDFLNIVVHASVLGRKGGQHRRNRREMMHGNRHASP